MMEWPMLIASRIHTARNTHSEYIILIVCPLQQWLQERASMLRLVHCPFVETGNRKISNYVFELKCK